MSLYTPQWPVIGHDWATDHLTRALNSGRLRHAYLISGPPNIGKTTFARALAMALNCTAEDGRPCGTCRACTLTAKNGHPDISIIEAERVGGTMKIEQIREIQPRLSLRPFEARFRVALFRRFHEANAASQNALLKTLEEPPKNVILMLTADDLGPLLPTILSRCQHLPLRPLNSETITTALTDHYGASEHQAALLARLCGGRIGWAIRALEDETLLQRRTQGLALLESLIPKNRAARFAESERLSKDKNMDKTALQEMFGYWASYWRDVLLMRQGAGRWIANIDYADSLTQWAERLPESATERAIKATQQASKYLNHNVGSRLVLDTLFLDYPFGASGRLR